MLHYSKVISFRLKGDELITYMLLKKENSKIKHKEIFNRGLKELLKGEK